MDTADIAPDSPGSPESDKSDKSDQSDQLRRGKARRWWQFWQRHRDDQGWTAPELGTEALTRRSQDIIDNVIRTTHLSVEDVMTPRADIRALAIDSSLTQTLTMIQNLPFSRYPIYQEDLDHIEGFIHAKDVLRFLSVEQGETKDGLCCFKEDEFSIAALIRKPIFVAPTMDVFDLLLRMQTDRTQIVLVVDEFGGIDGLVTIEDILEQFVGQIEDEHDQSTADLHVKQEDAHQYLLSGRFEIQDLEERFGRLLTPAERKEDIDTVGGLMSFLCGRVPIVGELITHPTSGIEFEIVKSDPRRVQAVRMVLPASRE